MTLDVLLRHLGRLHGNPLPPGVTMVDGKSKTLLGTGSNGHIVLKADASAAECTDVPVCVQGFVADQLRGEDRLRQRGDLAEREEVKQ